jgi:hypothetical protein
VIDEGNIGATIVALKAAAAKFDKLPEAVRLVEHDEVLQAHQWRRLALQHLEKAEAQRAAANTIHLMP